MHAGIGGSEIMRSLTQALLNKQCQTILIVLALLRLALFQETMQTIVATWYYCMAPVSGYSAFGFYQGNKRKFSMDRIPAQVDNDKNYVNYCILFLHALGDI